MKWVGGTVSDYLVRWNWNRVGPACKDFFRRWCLSNELRTRRQLWAEILLTDTTAFNIGVEHSGSRNTVSDWNWLWPQLRWLKRLSRWIALGEFARGSLRPLHGRCFARYKAISSISMRHSSSPIEKRVGEGRCSSYTFCCIAARRPKSWAIIPNSVVRYNLHDTGSDPIMAATRMGPKSIPLSNDSAPGVLDPFFAMWYRAIRLWVFPPPNEVSNLMNDEPASFPDNLANVSFTTVVNPEVAYVFSKKTFGLL